MALSGDCVIIPAGASYDRRIATDARYTNGYNFVSLDLSVGQGIVYLRRWSDRQNEWTADSDSCERGQYSFDLLTTLRHTLAEPNAYSSRDFGTPVLYNALVLTVQDEKKVELRYEPSNAQAHGNITENPLIRESRDVLVRMLNRGRLETQQEFTLLGKHLYHMLFEGRWRNYSRKLSTRLRLGEKVTL